MYPGGGLVCVYNGVRGCVGVCIYWKTYKKFYSYIIGNDPRLETTEMFISSNMDKYSADYLMEYFLQQWEWTKYNMQLCW